MVHLQVSKVIKSTIMISSDKKKIGRTAKKVEIFLVINCIRFLKRKV